MEKAILQFYNLKRSRILSSAVLLRKNVVTGLHKEMYGSSDVGYGIMDIRRVGSDGNGHQMMSQLGIHEKYFLTFCR